jgi:uncharacterized protein (DUF4415 family)
LAQALWRIVTERTATVAFSLPNEFWKNAKQGQFYRPLKQQLTLRLDADVIVWFKAPTPEGDGYQTHINRALRQYAIGTPQPGRQRRK